MITKMDDLEWISPDFISPDREKGFQNAAGVLEAK